MGRIKKAVDEIDRRIIECLRKNSRITMKELGEKVFLTGQAAKNRVERLEDMGIVQRYTVNIDCPVFGYKIHAIIRLQLVKTHIDAVKNLCKGEKLRVLRYYQTTGENCYFFDMVFLDMDALNTFLARIEPLCQYELHIVLKELHDAEL